MCFLISFLFSLVSSTDNIENHIFGIEYVDFVYNSTFFNFTTSYPNIYMIAQKVVNSSLSYGVDSYYNYYFSKRSTKSYSDFYPYEPIPLIPDESYSFNIPNFEANDDYLFYFFNGTDCDVIFYTNKDNDEMQMAIPRYENPCFIHFHKDTKLPVPYYSNVSLGIHKHLNLINIRVVFESENERKVDYPEIRGFSRFLDPADSDISNYHNSKIFSILFYISIVLIILILYSMQFNKNPNESYFHTVSESINSEISLKYHFN